MHNPWLVPISLALGIVVGAGLVLLIVVAVDRGRSGGRMRRRGGAQQP